MFLPDSSATGSFLSAFNMSCYSTLFMQTTNIILVKIQKSKWFVNAVVIVLHSSAVSESEIEPVSKTNVGEHI